MRSVFKQISVVLVVIVAISIFVVIDKIRSNNIQSKRTDYGFRVIRPPHEIDAFALGPDVLWAGGKDGLYLIDRKNFALISQLQHEPPFAYVRSLCIDTDGLLWIGHESGLTSYDGKTFFTYDDKNGLPDKRVNAVYRDTQGKLWVGTWLGLAVQENGQWKVWKKEDGLLDDMVNVIFEDTDHGMWFGSYVAPAGGLSYYKDGKWQYFSTANGLPHNNISALMQAKDGSIWVGVGLFDRGAAIQLVKAEEGWRILKVLSKSDGLAGEKARSIYEDADGALWIGSEYDGIVRFSNGTSKIFTDQDGFSHMEVKAILQDRDGNLWFGTKDGLTYIEARKLKLLP